MNTMITSKEEILKASRELIRQKGWEAVNIRAVAAACGVSVGAIYYYFDSKAELTSAAIASIWQEIFHLPDDVPPPADTKTCILWICERIKEGKHFLCFDLSFTNDLPIFLESKACCFMSKKEG